MDRGQILYKVNQIICRKNNQTEHLKVLADYNKMRSNQHFSKYFHLLLAVTALYSSKIVEQKKFIKEYHP